MSDIWKIQLTIAINFISSKDHDEEHVMHSKSNNIEFMIYDNADEVTRELFELLLNRYQIGLETPTRGNNFIFDYVYLLYYKCHKLNLDRDGSYIDFLERIKNKKATTNPFNKNYNEEFQCAVTATLYYEEIGKHPEITTRVQTFINKYNWEGTNYPSQKIDWKKTSER